MEIRHVFFALVFLGLLTGCGAPPAAAPPTPETAATQEPGAAATATIASTDAAPLTGTPTRAPSMTRTITASATLTATITPQPTRTSPYPVGLGTPIPDIGFPEINLENAARLGPVFKISQQRVWQTATSRDRQKLFVATNNGMFLFDRQGQQLAHWPSIILYHLPCEACLSINTDGSRFALATHKDGKWFAQVYNVFENNPLLLLEKPMDVDFRGVPHEALIAISPDGLLLAYGTINSTVAVIDMNNVGSEPVLTHESATDSVVFSPDGTLFITRRGRAMQFFNTATWKTPASLVLPAENIPFVFSPDGKRIAVVSSDRVLIYDLESLRPTREIPIRPASVVPRVWETTFIDDKILAGYNVRWDAAHTKATLEVAQWNIETGETLQMGSSETDSPDTLSALWGANISLTTPPGPVAIGHYDVFRFVDQDQLLVNSAHSACWLKISLGETACFDDPENRVLASQIAAYREVRLDRSTVIQDWPGNEIYELPSPYEILHLNWSAEYFMVNVKDVSTDIYFEPQRFAISSVAGTVSNHTENITKIVLTTQQKPTGVIISMVDKGSLETSYEKKADFILKPLALTSDNRVYFVQQDLGQPQVILKVIDGKPPYQITDVARLTLPAEPEVMAVAASGMLAFGMKDGSLALVSPDGQQVFTMQAIYSAVTGISFTSDGRYLALASDEGIRIYAVLPEQQ